MSSSSQDNENNFVAFAAGALIGGVIGTVLGIFLAPKSGTEMRYEFSESVHDAQVKTKQMLGDTKNSISQGVDKASKNLETTVKRVTESFNAGRRAAREVITDSEIPKSLENENSDSIYNKNIDVSDIKSTDKDNNQESLKIVDETINKDK